MTHLGTTSRKMMAVKVFAQVGRLGLELAEEPPDSGVMEIRARGTAPFHKGTA